MRDFSRRGFAVAAAVGLVIGAAAPAAVAQKGPDVFPSRTITIMVPFPPGGPPDVIARVYASSMQETLGKPVVVENRPGASTTIAHQAVARAEPDGYTLLAIDLSHAVVPHIMSKAGFDPVKDFKPIGRTALTVLTLVVNPNIAAHSAKELVALAKAKPGQLNIAHTGIGTPPHLGAVAFIQATGTDILQVPYKGAAIAINDVVGGHVSMLSTAPSTSVQLHATGKVRMLGMTGSKRLSALPDVPTLKEQGIDTPSLDDGVWFGLSAPAGTPDDVIAKLNQAINKAARDKSVIDTLAKTDISTIGGTPEDLGKLIKAQLAVWGDLMRHANVKAE